MAYQSKSNKASRALNSWLLFATLAFIVLAFFLYGFVYVENNEKEQIAKRFQVLAQISENISNKEKSLKRIAGRAVEKAQSTVAGKNQSDPQIDDESSETNIYQKFLDSIKEGLSQAKLLTVDLSPEMTNNHLELLRFIGGENEDTYSIYADKGDFFVPLERPAVFDHMMVVDEEMATGDDKEKKTGSYSMLYETFPGDLEIPDFNRLKEAPAGIRSGSLINITLSNKDYMLFLQPVNLDGSEKWFIGGFLEAAKFQRQIRQLDSDMVILFLMAFLVLIFAIPLIKLYLMKSFDQLDLKDAILTSLAIILLSLLMVLFNLRTYQEENREENADRHLKKLAQSIRDNFFHELHQAHAVLENFNNKDWSTTGLVPNDMVKNILSLPIVKNDLMNNSGYRPQLAEEIAPLYEDYNLFKVVSWMNGSGKQITQFSTRNNHTSLDNLGHRSYFKDSGNWNLPGVQADVPGNTDKKFMLESITSITSGEKLAAISIKPGVQADGPVQKEQPMLEGARVLALTSQMVTAIDTILPVGYGFCIIDKKGKVWFHSDKSRNVRENFIREVDGDQQLLSALSGNQSRFMHLDYQSKSQRVFVMPLESIPLFMVTFYHQIHGKIAQSGILINTSIFSGTQLVILLFLIGIIGIINYKKSLLKLRYIPFDWLRPETRSSSKKIYIHLTRSNLSFMALLLIFHLFAGRFQTFFLCLSTLLFSLSYSYYHMSRMHEYYTGVYREKFRLGARGLLYFLLGSLLLMDLSALLALELSRLVLLLLFQAILLVVLFLWYKNQSHFNSPRPKPGERSDKITARWYSVFLLCWMILVFVLPMLLFYNDAYNQEEEIVRKYSQIQLARNIESRNQRIDEFFKDQMEPNQGLKVNQDRIYDSRMQRKTRGIYAHITWDDRLTEGFEPDGRPPRRHKADEISYWLRPTLRSISGEQRTLVFPNASDYSLLWKKNKGLLYLRYESKDATSNLRQDPDGRYIYIQSRLHRFIQTLEGVPFILMVLGFILILSGAYFLIHFESRRIFGLDLMDRQAPETAFSIEEPGKTSDNPLLPGIRNFIEAGSHVLLLCQTREQVEEFYHLSPADWVPRIDASQDQEPQKQFRFKSDLVLPGESVAEAEDNQENGSLDSVDIVRIVNFELQLSNDPDLEELKKDLLRIEALLKLLKQPGLRVVMPSITPLPEVMEYYNETSHRLLEINRAKKGKGSGREEEKPVLLTRMAALINEVNDYMQPVYVPLKFGKESQPVYKKIADIKEEAIKESILKEFSPSRYFLTIQTAVYEYYTFLRTQYPSRELTPVEIESMVEKILLKIQELARHYYNSLVKSCSHKEKFVLYDMAQDQLMNANNQETISILIKKGLFVYDGTFTMMNESFRNYILCSIDTDEARQLIGGLSSRGRWHAYRAPIYLVIFGLGIMFSIQENLMSDLNTILTSIIGGFTILTKFSSALSGFKIGPPS